LPGTTTNRRTGSWRSRSCPKSSCPPFA